MNNERILVVDDEPANIRLLGALLSAEGYAVQVARNGPEALAQIEKNPPNLVLLDVVMPGATGYEVCEQLRRQKKTRLLPVILVTGARPEEERVQGLNSGADEFLTKPVNREELLARVRSLLRTEALHRQIAAYNDELETRVREQVTQLERLNHLKNFLPEKVAQLAVTDGGDQLLLPRRRDVTVCSIDLRGFTRFSEDTPPEEIMAVLLRYYETMGRVVERHSGTVERFTGDGMMIFFNAPVEIANPEEQAVRAAIAMRKAFESLRASWVRRGHQLGFGIGLANGSATIGAIGFGRQWQYSAIGPVTNLAARLCSVAKDGEILTTDRLVAKVADLARMEPMGEQSFRGLQKPIAVSNVVRLREEEAPAVAPIGRWAVGGG